MTGSTLRLLIPMSTRVTRWITVTAAVTVLILHTKATWAQPSEPLPSPLDAATVVRLARARRAEVQAARFRASAAAERPKIVRALPDPMLMVSLDHLPFSLDGFDGSVSVQQEFPLSGVLGARARAAEADAGRFRADARRTELDVEIDALAAFYLTAARRGTVPILDEQIAILEQLAIIARAHLGSGQGMQADVLRLDNERARLQAERAALIAETRAAEATLNAALARAVDAPVPELAWQDEVGEPAGVDALEQLALAGRPELDAARAERRRAVAEIDVMRSMYTPMALVRAGPAYSML